MVGIALECLGNLDRQFPRRRQHQHLRLVQAGIDAAQQRQRKSRRLAGAGLGLAEQIVAL